MAADSQISSRTAALDDLRSAVPDATPAELEYLVRAERMRALATDDPAPSAMDAPSPPAGTDIAQFVRSTPEHQCSHAILPADQIAQGMALIPAELARYCWLFAASRHPQHTVDLDSVTVEVGGKDHPSLTVDHLKLLLALYVAAQHAGVKGVHRYGQLHLVIRTRLASLHRLLTPDSPYGGSSHERILRQLQELRDTPVVFDDSCTRTRSLFPFIKDFWMDGRELTVVLHSHWSEPFKDETKKLLKPLLFPELRDIPGDVNKLVYLHLDWALAKRADTELRLDTILERCGAFHDDNATAPELRRFPSHQAWRLREIWQLQGRRLSSGEKLRLRLEDAKGGGKKLTAQRMGADHDTATAGQILDLELYRRQRQRWLRTPKAARLIHRGVEVPPLSEAA